MRCKSLHIDQEQDISVDNLLFLKRRLSSKLFFSEKESTIFLNNRILLSSVFLVFIIFYKSDDLHCNFGRNHHNKHTAV